MAATRVQDRQLKDAMKDLGRAQRRGDRAAVKTHRTTVEARSKQLDLEDARKSKDRINLINGLAFVIGSVLVLLILFRWFKPWEGGSGAKDTRRAFGWAALIVFGIYAGLGIIRWGTGGLLSFIRGKDGRLSTSLLQVGLWTFAVSSALVYFIFLAFYSSTPAKTFEAALRAGSQSDTLPEQYLLLLGGPFAAAVVARLTVGSKVADKEVQKVPGHAKLLDVIADDDEQANLVDAQFLVFNLVALTWFLVEIINRPTVIPDMPWLLVGLTSTSAIAYSAAKGVASNRPVVTSVTRYLEEASGGAAAIRPGDFVEIRGVNFVPEGAGTEELLARIVVKFGDRDATPRFILDDNRVLSPSDASIVARVPQATEPGAVKVSVVTAAGVEADSREITVMEDKPIIDGVRPSAARAGSRVAITGRFLRVPDASNEAEPSVRFGRTVVSANELTDGEANVTVPTHLAAGTLDLSIRAAGGTTWSDPVPLKVLPKSRIRRRS